ncbi:MAG TPA: CYCXC family (seleno)protein [Blastocatellia bacterium]|nr:CYCXC family (seleno)protein [Blastocatellia bacterium]
MRSEKRIIAAITLIVCLTAALQACNRSENHSAAQQHQPQASTQAPARPIPAHFTVPQDLKSLKPTLPPEQFTGKVRKAYQVAKEIPQTLTQLPCFCYCDTVGHKSLHSCYEDDHSAGCTVCVDSALLASELKQQGLGDAEIRDKLIAKYSSRPSH